MSVAKVTEISAKSSTSFDDALGDGIAGVVRVERIAGQDHRPAVGAVDPRHDLDQGRFSRPVLAQQRMDRAARQVQCHVFQCGHAGKGLGDVARGEDGFAHVPAAAA